MAGEIAAAGIGAVGGALGMIGQNKRAKKQHNRQKELMGIQLKNQQQLNKQGQQLQMQTWRDTNYGAQMDMMKEAGLNPALMYGMSGGGGATTGSQGGGSAQGGNSHAPMDIGASVQASLMMAQAVKLKAETKEIEERTKTESGKDDNIKAEFSSDERKQYGYMIGQIQDITYDNLNSQSTKAFNEGIKVLKEKNLLDETFETQKKMLEKDLLEKALQVTLTKEKINKTKEEIDVLSNSVYQRWTEIGIKGVDTILKGVLGGGGVGAIIRLMEKFGKK
jgi:hypothetical protein